MSDFDFPDAQLPKLFPLEQSFAENDIEQELKQLAIDLWNKKQAKRAFDVNVAGMAHLGSFELVRRSINQDGLALLPGGGEEPSTRYLYRAWKARNHEGRGLHFARLYLQTLFPGISKIEQLWLPLGGEYPKDCITITPEERFVMPVISDDSGLRLDGTWRLGEMIDTGKQGTQGNWSFDTSGLVLTSRVLITLDFSVDANGVGNLLQILRSVIPARFVPVFRYSITAESPFPIEASAEIQVHSDGPALTAFPGDLFVTDDVDWLWNLGTDDAPGEAPMLAEERVEMRGSDDPQ